MNLSQNNWFTSGYDESGRFYTSYDAGKAEIMSFKDALIHNAKSTIKEYPNETFDLMFSGGLESELILRTYLMLEQKLTVNIFEYENGYNRYDVDFANHICHNLGIKLNIFQFSLENFFKKDARDIYEKAKCSHARALPQLKFLDYVDNIPIYGSGDLRWFRPSEDYSVKCRWEMQDFEYDYSWDRYVSVINRPAIMQWFKFTPEPLIGIMQTKWFDRLVNNKLPGRLGINSTKIEGYREAYPELDARIKQTGFEFADHLIEPFQETLIEDLSAYPKEWFWLPNLRYSQYVGRDINAFYKQLTGQTYDKETS